ncbi:hypothetical protein WOLCODRAFT_159099 [Wolfiporia cocos MD-104 SS10]|uniref:Uncharacterized protein n=1 Tax=Wolfiporia cocos (strain MD-104) TaxID=742152 RepID=A0A2H3JTR8_WOLCO|nr:hypothetical protein WOLCODRAFT_159099 [Wolfiporia cocos MD-104 SS10]
MQCFNPDLPTRLIETLPEPYRRIFYEEKYEWRDPPTGFFMKGGYLTVPNPDRLSPAWVQIPPSTNDPWDQTHTAFKRFGAVTDIMTPTLTIHRADGQQQGGQMTNTPSTGGTMGVANIYYFAARLVAPILSEQTPPEQERLEEEAFLEGEVPQAVEARQAAEDRQEEAHQAAEDHQEEAHQEVEARQVEEPHQDGALRPHSWPEETA